MCMVYETQFHKEDRRIRDELRHQINDLTGATEETRARAELAAQESRTRDAEALAVRQQFEEQKLKILQLCEDLLNSRARFEELAGQVERDRESLMDLPTPTPPTGLPVYREGAGATEIQALRDELALVKTQLLDMTARRDSFESWVIQMRANTLTTEVRQQHCRAREQTS